MNFTLDLFYLFSFVLVASALVVVSAKNAVHSVMFLVLCFLNAAGLFVLLGAEFLAMLLIVVYVGAIAVLFLFVVMMLNVDFKSVEHKINRHLPILIMVGVLMLVEILLITKFSTIKFYDTKTLFPTPNDIHNTQAIGNLLYTDFILPFQLSGCVLFVAMIGAIVLTLKDETRFIRKQKICDQVARTKANSLQIVKVKSGEGIDL
ncbi:MAG: NADH-quinone oxidoreductase subunit J [Rickettsiales bacterium]|nr:NADH-quinone oxidoreductase subunit J [Rickettsiales bacterium]